MMREVLSLEPYRYNKGSKERGEAWNKIASNLNGIPDSGLNTTQRGVRTQYDKLMEDFQKKEKAEKAASGDDCDYDELDQLLNDVYERANEAVEELAEAAKEKEKAVNEDKKQVADMMNMAMERQDRTPNKRKSTVLKEVLEEGRKSKNEIELKKIALEEQRLKAEQERNAFFEEVVNQQQQQQKEQQKFMAEMQLQNSQVQLELLRVLRDIREK